MINAELPDDPTPLDFLDQYLDEEFYEYLTTQANLYAAQYLQANPNLPPHSRFQKWKDVSITEMKQLIAPLPSDRNNKKAGSQPVLEYKSFVENPLFHQCDAS